MLRGAIGEMLFGILGLVPGPLQPLPPVVVQAGTVWPDVFEGPTAQLQRGGLQGNRMVGEGILSLPQLAMIEDLSRGSLIASSECRAVG
jgi:hypothetical protein